jgi:hypothetical protein
MSVLQQTMMIARENKTSMAAYLGRDTEYARLLREKLNQHHAARMVAVFDNNQKLWQDWEKLWRKRQNGELTSNEMCLRRGNLAVIHNELLNGDVSKVFDAIFK